MVKKRYIIPPVVIVLLLSLGYFINLRYSFSGHRISKVKGTFSESYRDGCDGFILENGATIATFCFWTKPEDQINYYGDIMIGDVVEYGQENGKPFIRKKLPQF